MLSTPTELPRSINLNKFSSWRKKEKFEVIAFFLQEFTKSQNTRKRPLACRIHTNTNKILFLLLASFAIDASILTNASNSLQASPSSTFSFTFLSLLTDEPLLDVEECRLLLLLFLTECLLSSSSLYSLLERLLFLLSSSLLRSTASLDLERSDEEEEGILLDREGRRTENNEACSSRTEKEERERSHI